MNFFSNVSTAKRARFSKINLDSNVLVHSVPVMPTNVIYEMMSKKKDFNIKAKEQEPPKEKESETKSNYLIETGNIDINIPKTINLDIINVTFIIPTMGRSTLEKTIRSLQQQTCVNWLAIIIFDNVIPAIENNDPRILFMICNKLGEGSNYAGRVRNYGMNFVKTQWIAFLDDDDGISPNYVEKFHEEILNYSTDAIIFRMHFDSDILPELDTNDFYKCKVGISFAIKKKIVDSGLIFSPSKYEDYDYLSLIKSNNYTIMISPYVLYFVRDYDVKCELLGNRLFLNEKIIPEFVSMSIDQYNIIELETDLYSEADLDLDLDSYLYNDSDLDSELDIYSEADIDADLDTYLHSDSDSEIKDVSLNSEKNIEYRSIEYYYHKKYKRIKLDDNFLMK
jgi:glycosyltransferase involved in cell wall biosynthesis